MNSPRVLRTIGLAIAALASAHVGLRVVNVIANSPGGSRSIRNVVDFDPRLVAHAKGATPLIERLQTCINVQGTPPITFDELCDALPASAISPDASSIDGWQYGTLGNGFTLRKKLGWDPSLTYGFDGTKEQWIYDPGDGTPASTIQLLK